MIPCLHFGLRLASGRFPIEPKLASRVESGYKSPDSPGPRQRGRRRDGLSRRRRGRFRSTAPYPAATNSRGVSKPRARRDNGLTFIERMRSLLSEPRNQDEVPAARQLASLDAAIVLAEVARYYGVDQDCFQVRRSGLSGRDLAAWLVRHHSSATLRELAPIFGLNHPDSVNHLVRRVDLALARSSELREDIGMTQRILGQRRHGSS